MSRRPETTTNRTNRQPKADLSWMARLYCLLAALEGAAGLVYLLALPADPKTRIFWRFSAQRWTMITAMLLGCLVWTTLFFRFRKDRCRAGKLAEGLLRHQDTIPNLILALVVCGALLLGWLGIFQSDLLLKFNAAYRSRLAPFLAWGGLLLAQLWVAWFWHWKKDKFAIPRQSLDALLLLVLFLVSLIARARMTGYSLPYQSVWDEVVTYPQALQMLTEPRLKPHSMVPGYGPVSYGDLLVYLTTGGEVLGLFNGLRTQRVASVQEYVSPPGGVPSIFGAVHESGAPLRYPRLVLSLVNSLAPLGIFLALRKVFRTDAWSAFGGAFIYAILSRELLYYSAYILPDALAATLVVFLFLAAWDSMEDHTGRFAPLVACGMLAGMVLSVTVRAALVMVVPFLAFALASNHQRPFSRLGVTALGLGAGFVLTSPYALLDLPEQLARWTSFTWYQVLTLANRLSSLVYYFQGAFMPGFSSSNIDSSTGSVGLGLGAGFLATFGLGRLLKRFPRQTLLMLVFAALHLYLISSLVKVYTRHALLLYPLACIAAGNGLAVLAQGLREGLGFLQRRKRWPLIAERGKRGALLESAFPVMVLVLFLLISIPQLRLVARYIQRINRYQPVQVRMAEYLSHTLQPGEKVGILDLIPWVEADLERRDISFARIPLDVTAKGLRAMDIRYVVGTDRISGDYGTAAGTLWDKMFLTPGSRLAEFGNASLEYAGYPVNELYLFVAKVP